MSTPSEHDHDIRGHESLPLAAATPPIFPTEDRHEHRGQAAPALPDTIRDNEPEPLDPKAGILARLKSHGVKELTISYSGCCDDGSITDMEVTDPAEMRSLLEQARSGNSEDSPCVGALRQLAEDIEEFCTDELEDYVGGWEIDDGSDGTFTFDVEDGTVTCSHNQNVLTSENIEWEV